MEIELDIFEQNLKCPICLNIVEDPYETSCCGNLFCNKCKKQCVENICPLCRNSKFKFRKNIFARNLLNELDKECPYGCGNKIKLNNLKAHKYQCEKSKFKCLIDKCNFEGIKNEALNHIIKEHKDYCVILSENYHMLKNVFEKFEILNLNKKENNFDNESKQSQSTVKNANLIV
jgi:hypothetical protein